MPAPITNRHDHAPTLDGITLKRLLEVLVARYGWEELARCIDIRCFKSDPSIRSSLKFLRKTPWARQKVEQLYLQSPPSSVDPHP